MVKFKMDVKELADCINTIAPCIAEAKSVIKIRLLARKTKTKDGGEGNLIMFMCYDQKKQIATFSTALEVQMEENSVEMCIDGKTFSSYVMILGQREGYVSFEADKHISVEGANSCMDFALLDSAASLAKEKNALYQINIETKKLKAVLRRGGYAYLAGNKVQVNLRYVAIKFDRQAGSITVLSTNGSILAVDECSHVSYGDTDYPETSHTILIEGDQLKSILRTLTDENTLLEVYESQMLLKNGLNICLLRTADESYPTESLLKISKDQERVCEMKVSVAELLNAIEIINIAKTENFPFCVIKDMGENRICLQTKQGNGKTEITVQKQNKFSEVAVNADFLKMVICNYDKGAEVYFGVGGPEDVLIIKKEKAYAGVSSLMPLRAEK